MMRPTTLSASFAMVSPMYALPRLSGTCTLYQLLGLPAFNSSSYLFLLCHNITCWFSSWQGTCVLCHCQVHQIIVHRCDDRTELRPGDRGDNQIPSATVSMLRRLSGESAAATQAASRCRVVIVPLDLHASASCQPFRNSRSSRREWLHRPEVVPAAASAAGCRQLPGLSARVPAASRRRADGDAA